MLSPYVVRASCSPTGCGPTECGLSQRWKSPAEISNLAAFYTVFIIMNILISWLSQAGAWLTPWLNDIAMAIVASLLVVFGNDINRTLRRLLTGHHFIVRTLVFVAINAFGYGAFIIAVSPWLAGKMRGWPDHWLFAGLVATFIFIGMWAQRQRQI
ncbi:MULTISPECIES: DUF3392 domain-containing protein [Salinivibrio]|nr:MULTISPECIES: DUF3392 domain-containing protein [Salinivibrio]